MHELSIAVNLIETVCEELPRLGTGVRVTVVRMRIGTLSGVVPDALRFSFDVAAADSRIEGASLQIEEVPVAVYCAACRAERELASPLHLRCPVCDSASPDVRRGREVELIALEVVDDSAHC